MKVEEVLDNFAKEVTAKKTFGRALEKNPITGHDRPTNTSRVRMVRRLLFPCNRVHS